MVVAVQSRIDERWLEANTNEDLSFIERLSRYTSTTFGSFRSLSLIKSCSKLRNELGSTPSVVAQNLEKMAAISMSGLGLVRLPAVTKDAYDVLLDLGEEDGVSFFRKAAIAFRNTMEAIMTWCNASVFVLSNPLLRRAAQIADFGYDSADLCLSVNDYYLASTYEEASSGEIKEVFTHTRKYFMLRVAKAVLSIATAVFTAIMLMAGMQLLPSVLAIFLSLATTLTAFRRDLFKEEGKYKLIDLKGPVLF